MAASHTAHAAGPVTLTAEGTRFDLPIAKARVPAGGWMCDMGTVHYAQSEQGQGTCPICNLRLIQQE